MSVALVRNELAQLLGRHNDPTTNALIEALEETVRNCKDTGKPGPCKGWKGAPAAKAPATPKAPKAPKVKDQSGASPSPKAPAPPKAPKAPPPPKTTPTPASTAGASAGTGSTSSSKSPSAGGDSGGGGGGLEVRTGAGGRKYCVQPGKGGGIRKCPPGMAGTTPPKSAASTPSVSGGGKVAAPPTPAATKLPTPAPASPPAAAPKSPETPKPPAPVPAAKAPDTPKPSPSAAPSKPSDGDVRAIRDKASAASEKAKASGTAEDHKSAADAQRQASKAAAAHGGMNNVIGFHDDKAKEHDAKAAAIEKASKQSPSAPTPAPASTPKAAETPKPQTSGQSPASQKAVNDSQKAGDASKKAVASGTGDDHQKAVEANREARGSHIDAAKAAAAKGDKALANKHLQSAKQHDDLVQAHKQLRDEADKKEASKAAQAADASYSQQASTATAKAVESSKTAMKTGSRDDHITALRDHKKALMVGMNAQKDALQKGDQAGADKIYKQVLAHNDAFMAHKAVVDAQEKSRLTLKPGDTHGEKAISEMHADIDKASGLSDQQKSYYKDNVAKAVRAMPEEAQKLVHENVGKSAYYGDLKSLGSEVVGTNPKMLADVLSGKSAVGGAYSAAEGLIHLDGDFSKSAGRKQSDIYGETDSHPSALGTYAHELTHSFDVDKSAEVGQIGKFSGTKDWQSAYEKEIVGDKSKSARLSEYGRSEPAEGFAEFGRLLYGSHADLKKAEQQFPECFKFFRKNKLYV